MRKILIKAHTNPDSGLLQMKNDDSVAKEWLDGLHLTGELPVYRTHVSDNYEDAKKSSRKLSQSSTSS